MRLAVDVVILPDPSLRDVCIEANRSIRDGGIRLGTAEGEGLPHVSLAMGGMDDADVPALVEALRSLPTPPAMNAIEAPCSASSGITVLTLERTAELDALHRAIMAACAPYFGGAVDASMMALQGEPPHQRSIDFIPRYGELSGFDRFDPHVTLGVGETTVEGLPRTFPPGRLAVCHLGNWCTCRTVLAEVERD
jgi:hypothetical protein